MDVQFGIDAASYQGAVNWAAVDESTSFGWEKVTQGLDYVNPYWARAKTAMQRRRLTSAFTPGAYLFLTHGDGAGQARHFRQYAGGLTGFGLAIDVEPSPGSRPSLADVLACVGELRVLYPNHPIGGYAPHWYWGGQGTTWADWLWASEYLTGFGSPAALFPKVPASWWAAYGGRPVELLQFTSRAVVAGVAGEVDCSAFRGTQAAYAKLVAGAVQRPDPGPPEEWQVEMMRRIPELRTGSGRHGYVRRAQALLGTAGVAVEVDGLFGPATRTAVEHLQRAHGLTPVDGVIGHRTWNILVTGAP